VEQSIGYRFFFAGLFLLIIAVALRRSFHFGRKDWGMLSLQALFMYLLNYIYFYRSSFYLTSGIVALVFSTLPLFNIINLRIFMKEKTKLATIQASFLGCFGLCLVFYAEFGRMDATAAFQGVMYALIATFFASLGNIIAARNSNKNLPILQTNAIAMLMSGSVLLCIKQPLVFDYRIEYLSSLAYLTIFGTVIGFGMYLRLLKELGAARASYVTVLFPLVALSVSTFMEGYHWEPINILGVAAIVFGNVMILRQRKA
jgi:drug/metabolite transporter (DMT)-like permease